MQTEADGRDKPHRRHSDGKIQWPAVGVILAFTVNLGALIWAASARNSDVAMIQSIVAEVRASVSSLQSQSNANSVRLGVVESKVDDLRDGQRDNERLRVK